MTTSSNSLRCAVLTVGRSDFSIVKPLVEELDKAPNFEVGMWIGGGHFDEGAGRTVEAVEATGFPIWGRVILDSFEMTQASTVSSMSAHLLAVNTLLQNRPRPDLVIILGDRFEAASVGLGLVPHNIPIAHISGGSITVGAIDDVFRHCLTKMSSMHFCDTIEFASRIHRMGEPVDRVFPVGALGLDGALRKGTQSFGALAANFGFPAHFEPGYAVATLHPETRSLGETERLVANLIDALAAAGHKTVFTYPNADPGSDIIVAKIESVFASNPNFVAVRSFGADWFYTAMAHAGMMVGNSSSGIIEAASFGLPVVDVGRRQKGRFHGENVVHADLEQTSISAALEKVASPGFVALCKSMKNPYGDGRAANRIVSAIRSLGRDVRDPIKQFAEFDPSYNFEMAPVS